MRNQIGMEVSTDSAVTIRSGANIPLARDEKRFDGPFLSFFLSLSVAALPAATAAPTTRSTRDYGGTEWTGNIYIPGTSFSTGTP